MKKWVLLVVIVISLSLGLVYIFIPANLTISKITIVNCTFSGAYRHLPDESKWEKWWGTGDSFARTRYTYHVTGKLNNGVQVLIKDDNFTLPSSLEMFGKGTDSVALEWQCQIVSSRNPIKRILQYRQAVRIKKNMDGVIESLRNFLENTENVYDIVIRKSSVTDSLLIATKYITPAYPTTTEVYHFMKPLKEYAARQGATETGHPMLNVTKLDDNHFQTMVAIATNKELPGQGAIFPRKLIRGNFMVSEIKGGTYTINKALDEMQLYFDDYKKTSMAIPFQSLITDRSREPDTTKWVTKIYAPVMN